MNVKQQACVDITQRGRNYCNNDSRIRTPREQALGCDGPRTGGFA